MELSGPITAGGFPIRIARDIYQNNIAHYFSRELFFVVQHAVPMFCQYHNTSRSQALITRGELEMRRA